MTGGSCLPTAFPGSPAIRAIAIHPERSNTVFVGTQDGPYRTEDHGDTGKRSTCRITDCGVVAALPPRDPNIMFAGYESSEIYRSDDGGRALATASRERPFPRGDGGTRRQLGQAGAADCARPFQLR